MDRTIECARRRETILRRLKEEGKTISAAVLAKEFGVTRQIIVSDMALLRANGQKIVATKTGYYLEMEDPRLVREVIVCRHDASRLAAELYAIVDNGGKLENVIIEHPVYGQITGELNITSRYDANEFMKRLSESNASQLSELTDGLHYHTIVCRDPEIAVRIKADLAALGVLAE